MKPVALVLAACLAATPAVSQSTDLEEGMDLLSEGTRLLLRGLLEQMEPALRDLQGALEGMNDYHPPEILPNGDIIIRRKTPDTLPAPDVPGGEIEI